MPPEPIGDFVLGIDLGTNSLGWAIIGLVDDEPSKLVRAGVRVFQAGVNVDPKSGRENTLNSQRREARLHRRQLWRHRRRLVKVAHRLQRGKLLPPDPIDDSEARQRFFTDFDRKIVGVRRKGLLPSEWFRSVCSRHGHPEEVKGCAECHRLRQVVPYLLRASAAEEKLDPYFVGRALYHLAQRRGFWSNKKTAPKKDEKPGEVEQGIRTLRSEMGDKTLGQHFASLSPFDLRIRDRWTARDMYQSEFKKIWERQARHHPELLTDELRKELFNAIFEQRPLKLKRGLVGRCEFEEGERRAPAYLLISQRFRLLQVVNNLKLRTRGGDWGALSLDKRGRLIAALERRTSMEFKEVRELLGLTRSHSINLQRDKEETRMPGDDTSAQFLGVFGERWFGFERDRMVDHANSLLSVRDFDERRKRVERYLAKHGVENLGQACDRFLDIKFEAGHMNLSVKAMERFLPLLELGFRYGALSPHYRYLEEVKDELTRLVDAGMSTDKACEKVLTREPERVAPLDFLPPVLSEGVQRRIGAVRNPIVTRGLTELRKVVNAVVAKYGIPTRVHVELLRGLRKPKKEREKIWAENLSREKRARTIEEEIRKIRPDIQRVTPRDKEKYRLWQESEFCAYCQKPMTPRLLFGDDSEYQIDHIIPFSRWPDDAFVNKVLCHATCNKRKGQRTPFEAFSESPEGFDYEAMLQLIKNLKADKDTKEEKLRRFKMDHEKLEEFLTRRPAQQLNDSAYASRLAADYLALLYGGRVGEEGNLRVQLRVGGLTKYFREAWDLNSILGDGGSNHGGKIPKPRFDHRHHAIDAAVIACTDQDMFRRLSDAARRGWLDAPGRFGDFRGPRRDWNFREELKREILNNVVVSHRVSKKVSGTLHKETNYSQKEFGAGVRRHRVAIRDLSAKDITSDEVIPDKGTREAVRRKLAEIGGDPKKFPAPEEHGSADRFPCFVTRDGGKIPIKKVRVEETIKTRPLGGGRSARYVKPGGNHHLEIFGQPGADGHDRKWETLGVVTMLDAYERLRKRQPVVQRYSEPGWEFRFCLAQGETLEFEAGPHKGSRFNVRTISEEEKTASVKIEMAPINDARRKDQIKKSKVWITKSPNELRKWGARKIVISPLGEVSEAHD